MLVARRTTGFFVPLVLWIASLYLLPPAVSQVQAEETAEAPSAGSTQDNSKKEDGTGQPPWGTEEKGIQVRLRAKKNWHADEDIILTIDLKNQGKSITVPDTLDGWLLDWGKRSFRLQQISWEETAFRKIDVKQTIENYTTLQLHRTERMVEIRELRGGTLKSLYCTVNNPPYLVPGFAPFKMQPGVSVFMRLGFLLREGNLQGTDRSLRWATSNWLDLEIAPPGPPSSVKAQALEEAAVKDKALKLLAAIRDKKDEQLKEFTCDLIPGWTANLPYFAREIRSILDRFAHSTEPISRIEEVFVKGDFAAAKSGSGPSGTCLVLFFSKTLDGWRNSSLRNAPINVSLKEMLEKEVQNYEKAVKQRAATLIGLAEKGKFAEVTAAFDGTMRKALPEAKLAGLLAGPRKRRR